MHKHTILFLTANPSGTDRLALDEEARAIGIALERSGHRDRLELKTRWAARPLDLLDELRKLKPTVVHFSGHSGRGDCGLFFQAPDGQPQLVSAAALEETFEAAGSSVKLVVLNACYSEAQAEALLAHVGCVVGMSGSICDDAAISFAVGMYGGLGERQSIASAYKQGRAAINLEGLPDGDKPQLRVRAGIDADQLVLADDVALVQDLLTRDLATWGERHVFGNVARDRWSDDEAIAFLPLEKLYVEPDGTLEHDGQAQPSEPLLTLVERLTAASAAPRIVIVTADFGSGKSLSAREIARRWAEQRLTVLRGGIDVTLPIYVRCADDFPSETVDLKLTVRRTWKRQADGIGHSVAVDDDSLAWPSPEQRMICLLDGLDEVALGAQHLQTLFQKLRDETTDRHRFVIFSRPGGLPPQRELGDKVVTVRVEPFKHHQIEQWLVRWNRLHRDDLPIAMADLIDRGLGTIVRTPILLFMVAFTWGQVATRNTPPSIAEIYERFFRQIAAGKASSDRDPHRPIAAASAQLLAALQSARVLDVHAERPDAMLWLMGRVAWESHMLEQRHPSESLTRWHFDRLLRDAEVSISPDSIDVIRMGVILTLQADLYSANHTILFGHKSFREFLVGRHWAMSLRLLIRSDSGYEGNSMELLRGGRLLVYGDQSFEYLMQLINSTAEIEFRSAPLGWRDDERRQLIHWAQEIFNDERLEFGERARPSKRVAATLFNDQRAELREAALAIGSMTAGGTGMRPNSSLALRSMLAWFWLTSTPSSVMAPRAKLTGASLSSADLRRANLRGADLVNANLRKADLREADLSGAKLDKADLSDAMLAHAALIGADLSDADLSGADLCSAHLSGALLRRTRLLAAHLDDTDLSAADLGGTDLRSAYLGKADFRGAKLRDTDFGGADLRDANLSGVDFGNANLRGADLGGAVLCGADLSKTDLSRTSFTQTGFGDPGNSLGVWYDETTMWPEGFDRQAP